MRNFILIVTCFLLQATSLLAQTPDDYKIYELVIEDALAYRLKKIKKSKVISVIDSIQNLPGENSWVLNNFYHHMFTKPLNESELKKYKELTGSLIADTSPQRIDLDSLDLKLKTKAMTKEQEKRYFQKSPEDGWKKYYKANRKSVGIIRLSAVHYQGKRAAVYLSYSYDVLGGRGDVYFLEFKNNEWTIRSAFNIVKS